MKKSREDKLKTSKRLRRILCVAAFCCVFAAVEWAYWTEFGSRELTSLGRMISPPSWVSYQEREMSLGGYTLRVGEKKAMLSGEGEPEGGWTSPKEYRVQDGFLADLDRDGDVEMVLLLWKRGRFGQHRPFWITQDEKSYSQHIFIYDIEANSLTTMGDGEASADQVSGAGVKQKWFASDIGADVRRMKLMEQDGATILTEDVDGNPALWRWESFGLKNVDNEVTVVAFGDNIIHKKIYEHVFYHENGSFDFLYEPFAKDIAEADIAAVNAETVLVDKREMVSDYPRFGSPIEVGQALRDAGFDVVSCANNHALDKGINGIDTTSSFYKENGMTCVGIQGSEDAEYKPFEVISRNGIRIALLSYTYGTNDIDVSDKYPYAVHYLTDGAAEDIRLARQQADFVIVFAHWGEEYETEVSEYQRSMAAMMAEAGADVVIGSHPHVVQQAQMLERSGCGSTLVYYSLGNFRADQKYPGAKALFTIEHTYDGPRVKSWGIEEFDAAVKVR